MDQNNEKPMFYLVEFLELPYREMLKYAVVPRKWITSDLGSGQVLVAYPVEDLRYTMQRVLSFESVSNHWRSYLANIFGNSNDLVRLQHWCIHANQLFISKIVSNNVCGTSERRDHDMANIQVNRQRQHTWHKLMETATSSGPNPMNTMYNFSAPKSQVPTRGPNPPVNVNEQQQEQYAPVPTMLPLHNSNAPYLAQLQNFPNAHGHQATHSNNMVFSYSNVEINTVSNNNQHITRPPRLPYTSVSNQRIQTVNNQQSCPSHRATESLTWTVSTQQNFNDGIRAREHLPDNRTDIAEASTVAASAIPRNNKHEQIFPKNMAMTISHNGNVLWDSAVAITAASIVTTPTIPKNNGPGQNLPNNVVTTNAHNTTVFPTSSTNTNEKNPTNDLLHPNISPANLQAKASQISPLKLNKSAGLKQAAMQSTMVDRTIDSKYALQYKSSVSRNMAKNQNSSTFKSGQTSLQSSLPIPVLEPKYLLSNEDEDLEEPKLVIDESAVQTPPTSSLQVITNQSYTSEKLNKLNPQAIYTPPVTNTQLFKPSMEAVKSVLVVNNSTEKSKSDHIKNCLSKSPSDNISNTVSVPHPNHMRNSNKAFECGAQSKFAPSSNSPVHIKQKRRLDETAEKIKNVQQSSTSAIHLNALEDKSFNRKRLNFISCDDVKKPKIVKNKVMDKQSHSNANKNTQLPKDLNDNLDDNSNSSSLCTITSALKKLNTTCEPVYSKATIDSTLPNHQNIPSDQKSNSSVVNIMISSLKKFGDLSLKLDAANIEMLKETNDLLVHNMQYVNNYQKFSTLMNNVMHSVDIPLSNNSVQSKGNDEVGKILTSSKEISKTDSVSTNSSELQEVNNETKNDEDKLTETQANNNHYGPKNPRTCSCNKRKLCRVHIKLRSKDIEI